MGAYTIKGIKVHVDGYIWDNVQAGKELIAAKFDNVLCVDGYEGTGKSEFAFQWAIIQTEGKFTENDVFYTSDQFEAWIHSSKKGDVGVWDEFVLAGMSTDALTKMQNIIIKQFTIMRSKGLTVILVIPYYFMLRKYFAIARTRALVHVYANGLERGHLKFYNYHQKHWMYIYGQKTWLYSPKITPSFKANFWVWSDKFINHDKINKIKDEALKSINETDQSMILTPKQIKQLQMNAEINVLITQKDDKAGYNMLQSLIKKIKDYQKPGVI